MDKHKLPIPLLPRERTWGIRYLLFQVAFLGVILSFLLTLIGKGSDGVLLSFLYFLVNLVAVVLIFRSYLWRSAKHSLSRWIDFLFAICLGLGIYLILTPLLNILIKYLQPGYVNPNDNNIEQNHQSNPLLNVLGTVLLVPLAEETMCRGLVFGTIHSKNRWLAYILSTLFFAFLHVANYIGVLPATHMLSFFVQYIPAGLVLAWSYEHSGSIFAPFVIHTAVNAIGVYSMKS